MFKFQTSGTVEGLITGKDSNYVRIKPNQGFTFTRAGETPALIPLILRDQSMIAGLTIGAKVLVEGVGGLGVHEWTKKEFGKEKTKDITNYYFVAEKITPAGK